MRGSLVKREVEQAWEGPQHRASPSPHGIRTCPSSCPWELTCTWVQSFQCGQDDWITGRATGLTLRPLSLPRSVMTHRSKPWASNHTAGLSSRASPQPVISASTQVWSLGPPGIVKIFLSPRKFQGFRAFLSETRTKARQTHYYITGTLYWTHAGHRRILSFQRSSGEWPLGI